MNETNQTGLEQKYEALKTRLGSLGPCAVAFSAGVDSTLLLTVAHDVLGSNVLAITVDSPVYPTRELDEALQFCKQREIRHVVFQVNEFDIEGFANNPPERCYLCKRHLFGLIKQRAVEEGFPTVLEGSNTDDMSDYRPGFAAVQELDIQSPLLDAQLSKQDVRELSTALGLPTAVKQSFACLATRFPTNTLITPEGINLVDAAEQVLLDNGFQVVRVRCLPEPDGAYTARIEVGTDEVAKLTTPPLRNQITEELLRIGFSSIEVDPKGYRTGSMNIQP